MSAIGERLRVLPALWCILAVYILANSLIPRPCFSSMTTRQALISV
jgi:hypothetical protein